MDVTIFTCFFRLGNKSGNSILSRGFDMDKYIQNSVVSDFYITDKTITSSVGTDRKTDGVASDIISMVKSFDGIAEAGCTYLKLQSHTLSDKACENAKKICEEYKKELPEKYVGRLIEDIQKKHEIISRIYGIDGISMKKAEIYEGKLDEEKFKSGNYIIVSSFSDNGDGHYYDIGDKVTIDFKNGKTKEYEVMAIGDVAYALSPQFSNLLDVYFIMYSDEFIAKTGQTNALNIAFNAKDGRYADTQRLVEKICKDINPSLDYKSREAYSESFKDTQNMYLIIGGILSFILGLIGILNFINSMITSISARQHEFAILQAIGMTKSRLKRLIICEGLLYAAASAIFTLTVGNLISFAFVKALSEQLWFFTYRFTALPIISALILLCIFSAAIPALCCDKMCKRSITERLVSYE